MRFSWLVTGLLALMSAESIANEISAADQRFFESRIRPLLVSRCIECHGPSQAEAGLRLDSLQRLLQGGERGPAAVAGQPGVSLLLQAVRRAGDLQMPPERPIKPNEVSDLETWIRRGLPWPTRESQPNSATLSGAHWAFQPVREPDVPVVSDPDWCRTPIDRFVLARLEKAGIPPAPTADRATLIRRASFDLVGLPPTPEQVVAFQQDQRPDAWPRLIERLLASPAYGERWGRHWLDVARYADNKGYVFFERKDYPWAYTYRDYVIEAFNSDLPFDRFVIEQLAADRLPEDAPRLQALGFLTVGGHFMNNTHDIIDDRIDVVTRGLMGLTVTCARCHDHKYDPVPTADYYALYGVFRSSYEPLVPPLLHPVEETPEYREYAAEMVRREQTLDQFVRSKHRGLIEGTRTRMDEYLRAVYDRRDHPAAEDFMLIADTNDINPSMITRWESYLKLRPADDPIWQPWLRLTAATEASFSDQLRQYLAELDSADSADTTVNRRLHAALRDVPPQSVDELAAIYGRLFRDVHQQWQQSLNADTAEANSTSGNVPPEPTQLADPDQESLRQEIYGQGKPTDVPVQMDWGFLSLFPDRATQNEYKKLLKEVEEWTTKGPAAPPRVMALLDADQPFDPQVFVRGNPHRLGPAVPRRFLSLFDAEPKPFTDGSGRLELARRIASSDNPLTARVLVNRIWLHHFGRGLVETPGDFGLRGNAPTHPRLLDFLADELVRGGWSIKSLHRSIMLSSTYCQSTGGSPEAAAIDPRNRLLWCMPRRRLDFESTRDALLSVGGLLRHQLGGPPVDVQRQLQPRRTIYGFIDRMDVSPLLTTFDFPNPAASSSERELTTVAPQALYFMNHAHLAQIAAAVIRRSDVHAVNGASRVERLYWLLFGRPAGGDEVDFGMAFVGDEPNQERWARYVHALLMTNEFVFVD